MQSSEKQIEIENILRSVGSGETVPSDVIEEVVEMANNSNEVLQKKLAQEDETTIRIKMLNEKDWRKKATMAAMILSKSLE